MIMGPLVPVTIFVCLRKNVFCSVFPSRPALSQTRVGLGVNAFLAEEESLKTRCPGNRRFHKSTPHAPKRQKKKCTLFHKMDDIP